jgi:O-antigen ligase
MRANTLPRTAIAVPRSLLATCTDKGSAIAYLRALTLTAWFGSMVFNYWWRQESSWTMDFHQQGINLKDYYYIGFAIALTGHLTLGLQKWLSAPFAVLSTIPCRLLTVFCVLMLLLSPLSGAYRTSAIYAVATWMVLVLCHMYWSSDYNVVRRVLVFTGILLFVWLLVLLLHHGLRLGFGSSIGGINRNTTSTLGLGALVCTVLSPKKSIRIGAFAAAGFFAVVVTSRGSMLALCVFAGVYYALNRGTSKAVVNTSLAVFALVAILMASSFMNELILNDILRVDDENRGVGSGFTGRWEKWQNGFRLFWESPIIGHGFRAAAGGVGFGGIHSGYIKLLVENGILGTGLIISTVGIELLQRSALTRKFRTLQPSEMPGIDLEESLRINVTACATLCCIATLWIYEPLYINLGSVISVMLFVMLTAPRFISVTAHAARR